MQELQQRSVLLTLLMAVLQVNGIAVCHFSMFYLGNCSAILNLFCPHILFFKDNPSRNKTHCVREQTAFLELLRSFITRGSTFSECITNYLYVNTIYK